MTIARRAPRDVHVSPLHPDVLATARMLAAIRVELKGRTPPPLVSDLLSTGPSSVSSTPRRQAS